MASVTYFVKVEIEAWVGEVPPFLLYLPAVTVSAWAGGLGPGLLATALGVLVCLHFRLPPVDSLLLGDPNDRFRLVVFLSEGALISALMERLHASRQGTEVSNRALRASEQRFRSPSNCSPVGDFLADIAVP